MTRTASQTTGTIPVNGVELAYTRSGSGPVVIIAHGLMSSRAGVAASGLSDPSPLIDAGYSIIEYDARGHGESTGTADPDDYLWASLADDLLSFADAVAPGEKVALLGTSMGTATSIFAALKAPERIGALILTAPPTAWETRVAQSGTYTTMADAIEQNDQETLERLFAQVTDPAIFAEMAAQPPEPDIKPELLPTILRGAAATDLPSLQEIANIRHETLLLPWATDPGHPVSTAFALAEAMINSRLRIAHTVDQVEAYGSWTARFLQEVYPA